MNEIKNCLLQFTKLYQVDQPDVFVNRSKLETASGLLEIYKRWITTQPDTKSKTEKDADGSEIIIDPAPAMALVKRFMDSDVCQNWQR